MLIEILEIPNGLKAKDATKGFSSLWLLGSYSFIEENQTMKSKSYIIAEAARGAAYNSRYIYMDVAIRVKKNIKNMHGVDKRLLFLTE